MVGTPPPEPVAAGPAQAPQVPANAHPRVDVRVTVPNLRNGEVADIVQAAPRASVPGAYKWPHIEDLSAVLYITHVGDVIRACYAQVLSQHGPGPTEAERGAARKAAIVLGSIRAGAASAHALTPNDFNTSEMVATGSKYERGAIRSGGGTGTSAGKYTVAVTMETLTAAEEDVVNALLYLGFAVPVMQGISLTTSGHHYLPTTRNIFDGMKRQTLQAGGQPVTTWVEGMGDQFEDLAFHKSCHPILPSLKRGWAKSEAMAARLTASGHGAAAIRLPALPADAQSGKASVAVLTKAAPVVRGMGHTISWNSASQLIRAVELAAEGRDELAAVSSLRAWYVANMPIIAFCAGIVQHVRDSTGVAKETTLNAYSIKKAMSDYAAEVAKGSTYARAHFARVRDQADRGEFPDPNITV